MGVRGPWRDAGQVLAHSGAQVSSLKLRVALDSSEGPLSLCHYPSSCLCPCSLACFFRLSLCLLQGHSSLVLHPLSLQPLLCLPLLFLDGWVHSPHFQPRLRKSMRSLLWMRSPCSEQPQVQQGPFTLRRTPSFPHHYLHQVSAPLLPRTSKGLYAGSEGDKAKGKGPVFCPSTPPALAASSSWGSSWWLPWLGKASCPRARGEGVCSPQCPRGRQPPAYVEGGLQGKEPPPSPHP